MADSLLTRSLRVLDEISKSPKGLRFSEVQTLLGNPSPSTVSKILKELGQAEVLHKNGDGRYVLGMKTYFWGKNAVAQRGPMKGVRRHMRYIHETFLASVNLFSCFEEYMFCMESIMSHQSPSLFPAGKGLPLQLPVIGSIFFYPREKLLEQEFLRDACAAHSPNLDPETVAEIIRDAWRDEMQFDPGVFYPGICRLAVPLKDDGRVALVLGVGVLMARVGEGSLVEDIKAYLREAKAQIEEEMQLQ